jgi:citrate lyase subunit beta/citryl-CoA lyase
MLPSQTPLDFRALRSLLYVPADKPRALARINGCGADAAILDLEDAVAPEAKQDARRNAVAFLGQARPALPLFLRVNALETPFGADDLAAAARAAPSAIVLPKVETGRDIAQAAAFLGDAGAENMPLLAMIESPLALFNFKDIACAAPGFLKGFVAGTNDFAKATGIEPGEGRRHLEPVLLQIVCAARAFGVAAFDGVMNRLDDEAGLAAECAQGRRLGFDGKTLIHPSQIATANAGFAPGEAALARAHAIIDAFALPENAGKGAIRLDGAMVERLHLEEAEALLARAGGVSP